MAYTVMVDGVPIQCETAADAIELARQAGGHTGHGTSRAHSSRATPGNSRWTEQRVKDFYRAIKAQQRKLVDALLDTNDALTDDQLCKVLNLNDGRSLAGVFTGLFKNAKKVGADPKELYEKKSIMIGDRRQSEYTLADSFRTAAKNWKP